MGEKRLCPGCAARPPEERSSDTCYAYGYRPFLDRPELCATHPRHDQKGPDGGGRGE
jgi:hypothetical protein